MSFSKTVKEEIIKKNQFKLQTKPLLQGLILSCGSLVISSDGPKITASSESEIVINFIRSNLLKLFPEAKIEIIKAIKSFKQKERYELSIIGDENREILVDLGILKLNGEELEISDVCDLSFMKSKDSMAAFLAGVFLGAGTVSVPTENNERKSYGYHFEVVLSTEAQAELVLEIFSNFDIFPKKISRGDQFAIYLKNSEAIFDTLSLFGSSKAVLDLLNDKVSRDLNNATNRQMNCFAANVDKAALAAAKQMDAIKIIQNTIGIENLPDTLAEAALARLSNPESSLNDLLNVLSVKISKGALAQRFKKIIQLSKELGDEDAG